MTPRDDANAEEPTSSVSEPESGAAMTERSPTEPDSKGSKDLATADTDQSEPLPAATLRERGTLPDAVPATDAEPASSLQLKHATLIRSSQKMTLSGEVVIPEEAVDQGRQPDPYVGCVIDGRYLIEKIVARGGMGVVYAGRHQVIDKRVAIKVLKPDFADDDDVTARFLMEAKAASQIGNVRIIDVTDFGQLPDGATYLVMEFLEGQSLGKLIRTRALLPPTAADERLRRTVHIGRQIADGLHAAHEAGIIHRDLKPDNLFLVDYNGEPDFVKILDFGIAKVASSQNQQTRAGKVFGTPHYMSPEQAAGKVIDRRTDIYALGVILYEMSAGQTPFDAENPLGILTQHLYVPPPPPSSLVPDPDVAPALEAVILKCLSKDPDARYQTMEELEKDLGRVAAGEVPLAVGDLLARKDDESLPHHSLRAARRGAKSAHPPWGVILPVVMVLILVAGFLALGRRRTLEAEPAASASASAAPVRKRKPRPAFVSVALVMSPIDAHVFSGNRDLGMMPINIKVQKNTTAVVEVRREGFETRRVRIDGTRRRLEIRLKPLPGSEELEAEQEAPLPAASAKTYVLEPVIDDSIDFESGPLSSAVLENGEAAGGAASESTPHVDTQDLVPDLDEVDRELAEESPEKERSAPSPAAPKPTASAPTPAPSTSTAPEDSTPAPGKDDEEAPTPKPGAPAPSGSATAKPPSQSAPAPAPDSEATPEPGPIPQEAPADE